MTKRKKNILGGFQFNKIDPYGGTGATETQLKTVHIGTVIPDQQQPRSLMSPQGYAALFSGDKPASSILSDWLEEAKKSDAAQSLQHSAEKLSQLATTIEHQGLINPITVRLREETDQVPEEVEYIIVAGERRWWAHVLLTLQDRPIMADQHPDRIQVLVSNTRNIRAVQLIENIARDDLSLIEKAKGMIALKEELAEVQGGKVTWGDVEKMLSMSRSYRTRVLKVLKLTPEAQQIVAQHNLTEKTIRPITEHLQTHPTLQQIALQQIIAWQKSGQEDASFKKVHALVRTMLAPKATTPEPKPAQSADTDWVIDLKQRLQATSSYLAAIGQKPDEEIGDLIGESTTNVREELLSLRTHIDSLLNR